GPKGGGSAPGAVRRWRTASAAPHSGDTSAVVPPVPIPNTEVKRCSPDGSTATGRARVGRRQSKMPDGLPHRVFYFLAPSYSSAARRDAACHKRTESIECCSRHIFLQRRDGRRIPAPPPVVPQSLPRTP